MLNKKIMVLTIFLVSLLAVSAVSAADNAMDDIAGMENQDNDVISEVDDSVLKASPKTFTDLNNAINGNSDSDVYLDANYTYNPSSDSSFSGGVSIDRAVTVHGNGFTIDGANSASIFSISDSDVVLRDIVFVNGCSANDYGGALYGGSAVNCTFVNNSAEYGGGAIWDGSAVNCTFVNNSAEYGGGAIWDGSAVNCTFVNNSAVYGGAVNGGDVVNCIFTSNFAGSGGAVTGGNVVNCIFTSNSASYGGAVISGSAVGCTFVNNSAVYGGAVNDGYVVNCTFVNNSAVYGGAMDGGTSLYSIFRKNHADYGGAVCDVGVHRGLFEYNSANNGGAMSGGWTNKCIFNYNSATESGGAVYEAKVSFNSQFSNNYASDGNDTYDVTWFEKETSFIDLYELINEDTKIDIYLNHNYTFDGITDGIFKDGINVNRAVTIHGNGHTIDGVNSARIFNVSNSNVVFRDIIFVNGYSASNGGALYGGSAVNCTFVNNSASNGGGALYGGSAVNCIFTSNSASNDGGAVNGGDVVNCTFVNNSAGYGGGAVNGGDVVNCIFTSNSAVYGGAVISGSAVGCTFVNNSASNDGGALYGGSAVNCSFIGNRAWRAGAMFGGSAVNCIFTSNSASNDGGAVNGGDVVNCTFVNNSANRNGGAICDGSAVNCIFTSNSASYGGAVNGGDVVNCTFVNNSASNDGGALYGGSAVNCTFVNNSANRNGGAICDGSANICLFINNNAINGGAIYGECSAVNCTFENNNATLGGAIYSTQNLTVNKNLFVNNTAQSGGAIYDCGNYFNISDNSFTNNKAMIDGGAIYLDGGVKKMDESQRVYYSGKTYNIIVGILDSSKYESDLTYNNLVVAGIWEYSSDSRVQRFINYYRDGHIGRGTISDEVTVPSGYFDYNRNYLMAAGEGNVGRNIFLNNNATEKGGAIYSSANNLTIEENRFINNSARNGSAIWLSNKTQIRTGIVGATASCQVVSRYADRGIRLVYTSEEYFYMELYKYSLRDAKIEYIMGNIEAAVGNNVKISKNTFTQNSADAIGNPIIDWGMNTTIENNTINSEYGSTIYSNTSDVSIIGNIFDDSQLTTVLSINVSTATYINNDFKFIITLTDERSLALPNQLIRVTIKDEVYSLRTGYNGVATVAYRSDALEEFTIYARYIGNILFKESTSSLKISVTKIDTFLTVPDAIAVHNSGVSVVATLKDAFGNPMSNVNVKITVGTLAKTLKTDANGQVSLDISSLAAGTYAVEVKSATSDLYERATANASATVYANKINTVLTVPNAVAVYNSTGSAVATLKDIYGNPVSDVNVKVTVGSLAKTLKTDANGKVALDISSLTPGTYGVDVKAATTVIYNRADPVSATAFVSATKVNTTLTVSNAAAVYKTAGSVVATLKDIYGNVIEGVNVKVTVGTLAKTLKTDANGQVSLAISDLSPKSYTVSVKSAITDVYERATASASAIVSMDKIDTTLVVPDAVGVYNVGGNVVATLKDINGNPVSGVNVKITVGDLAKTLKTDENGQVSLGISSLAQGTYVATVKAATSDVFNRADQVTANVVSKLPTVLTVPDVVAYYGRGSVVATLKDINGKAISDVNVKITVGSLAKTLKTDKNGKVSLDIGSLAPGTYDVAVKSAVADLYDRTNTTANVVVNKLTTELTVPTAAAVYNVGGSVVATLKDMYGNVISGVNVKITVGTLAKTLKTDNNGKVSLDISSLAPGTYDVAVKSATGDFFDRTTANSTAIVSTDKFNTTLTISNAAAVYNTSGSVVATLKDIYGNVISNVNVKVTVGSLAKTMKTDANGQVALDISSLAPKSYTVSVKSATTDVYERATASASAIVSMDKIDTTLVVPDAVGVYNVGGNVVATLKDINGNPVSGMNVKITVGDLAKTLKTDENGQVSLGISSLAQGTYVATVKAATSDVFNRADQVTANVILKLPTTLTVPKTTVTYNESGYVVATLKDMAGKAISGVNVKITVGTIAKTLKTDANGKVSLDIKGLAPGNYTATIKSATTDVYERATATSIVVVNKLGTELIVPDVITLPNAGSIVAILKDVNDNVISNVNVKITVGSIAKTLKTDANGRVSLDVSSLAVGSYDVSVKSATTDIYERATASATLDVVSQLPTTLTVPDVTTTQNSGKKMTATLRDVNGNPVSGVNVKISVGTIAKTLKTDANGKVSLDVSTLAPGSYTATIKSANADSYSSTSTTAKVKIN